MDMSKLSAADKRILYASIGVIVGGIVGLIDHWGFGGTIGLLAGLAAAGVVLLPQLAPTMKLPAAKSLVLLGCGVAAAGGFGLAVLTYIGYALDITRIYSILFDLGFVAALVLLWLTWTAYSAGQGASAPPVGLIHGRRASPAFFPSWRGEIRHLYSEKPQRDAQRQPRRIAPEAASRVVNRIRAAAEVRDS